MMMTIEDPPVTFGLWSGSWVGGDQVAGLLRCALRAPGHHYHDGGDEFDDDD